MNAVHEVHGGLLSGACSHKGTLGFGPIRRQPHLSELAREVHGGHLYMT